MNLFRAFMELDEACSDRQAMIYDLKKSGKRYNFNKYTDAQIFRMWQNLQKQREVVKEPKHELDLDFVPIYDFECCDFCGTRLTDFGQCPECDLGEEDLSEWITASGQKVDIQKNSQTTTVANSQHASSIKTTTGKYRVSIVLDNGRLRAMADDGIHGLAFVAFPNHLREFEGQYYEVDQLIWNGKNYRVSGNIEEV